MAKKRRTLFDPDQAAGPAAAPHVGSFSQAPNAPAGSCSVSQLVRDIRQALDAAFPKTVTVLGEISSLSRPASGHLYFTLKDADAAIPAVMWKSAASRLPFTPQDGLAVIAKGKVDLYDVQGKVQLYIHSLTPRGQGELELAFRQMKEKLSAEGLFDPTRKKTIPPIPVAIGVITSESGAAIRDIQRTLAQRWPAAKVYLLPVPVQGENAAEQIARAITRLDRAAGNLGIETILLARGGGSLEDLWAFNKEPLARAVAGAATPIISGVGHESDLTICDLVADLRAATPTAAAQAATPDRRELTATLADRSRALHNRHNDRLHRARLQLAAACQAAPFRNPMTLLAGPTQQLDELAVTLARAQQDRLTASRDHLAPLANRLAALHPARLIDRANARLAAQADRCRWALGQRAKLDRAKLDTLAARIGRHHPQHRLALARQHLTALDRQLHALSYRNTLRRGFSVTRSADGDIIRSANQLQPGQTLLTELADGKVASRVDADPASTPKPKRKPSPNTKPPSAENPTLFDPQSNP
jgi:exodeoxyribonuclease VII large subunit